MHQYLSLDNPRKQQQRAAEEAGVCDDTLAEDGRTASQGQRAVRGPLVRGDLQCSLPRLR